MAYYPNCTPYPQYPPYSAYPPPPQQQQARTVEVLPVDTEDEVYSFRMNAGGTGVFAAKNGRWLAVKSVELNGDTTEEFFDLRPPAPKPKPFDPGDYVRKDEFAALVAEIRRRDAAENESV